jgi:hypothetical protein
MPKQRTKLRKIVRKNPVLNFNKMGTVMDKVQPFIDKISKHSQQKDELERDKASVEEKLLAQYKL